METGRGHGWVTLLVVLLLACPALAACGDDGPDGGGTSGSASSSDSDVPESLDELRVTLIEAGFECSEIEVNDSPESYEAESVMGCTDGSADEARISFNYPQADNYGDPCSLDSNPLEADPEMVNEIWVLDEPFFLDLEFRDEDGDSNNELAMVVSIIEAAGWTATPGCGASPY